LIELNAILDYLRKNLSERRYEHTLGVSDTAVKLAERYGCDVQKARLAGLLHDCAREMDKGALLACIKAEGMEVDDISLAVKELLHGPAAVHICRKVFNIQDEDVLNAVRYHTVGREDMSVLEKIIYISDFIEPRRNFEGVSQLRSLSEESLDMALQKALDLSISYVISKNGLIHTNTVLARNFIIKSLMDSNGYNLL